MIKPCAPREYIPNPYINAGEKAMKTRKITAPRKAIVIHHRDNVATAFVRLVKDETVDLEIDGKRVSVRLQIDIPPGYKFALHTINRDTAVIKYGEPIGLATADIQEGELVHVHNVEGTRGRGDRQ